MSQKKNSTRNKILAILTLIGAITTATVMYLDGDDTTEPDISEVIDASEGVVDSFKSDD